MNVMRKILAPFLIIPVGMLIYVCVYPDWQWENPGLEYLFLVAGLPILILNFLAWFHPEIIRAYFPMKEDGWQRTDDRPIALTIVIGAFMAFIILGVGAASAIHRVNALPMLEPSATPPAREFVFPVSTKLPSKTVNSSRTAVVSTPTRLPESAINPNETAQVPVSGEVPTNVSVLSATPTEASSVSIEPTKTAAPVGRCIPASQEYLEAVGIVVYSIDPANEVKIGWAVQSKDEVDLWFLAAKIYGPEIDSGATLPAVWALFVSSDGYIDIYSINTTAMEFSYAFWGEDSVPVTTMQSDGAQEAYDCAVSEN